MDKVNSKKLTALISRLTVAANKAIKTKNEHQDSRKHYFASDFHRSIKMHINEQNLRSAKLIK